MMSALVQVLSCLQSCHAELMEECNIFRRESRVLNRCVSSCNHIFLSFSVFVLNQEINLFERPLVPSSSHRLKTTPQMRQKRHNLAEHWSSAQYFDSNYRELFSYDKIRYQICNSSILFAYKRVFSVLLSLTIIILFFLHLSFVPQWSHTPTTRSTIC